MTTDRLAERTAMQGDHPEATCQRCGRSNRSWVVDSDRFNTACNRSEVVCPSCFIAAHEAATGMRTTWQLTPATPFRWISDEGRPTPYLPGRGADADADRPAGGKDRDVSSESTCPCVAPSGTRYGVHPECTVHQRGTWTDPQITDDDRIDHENPVVRAVAERLHSNESTHMHDHVSAEVCAYCALRTTRVLRWATAFMADEEMGGDTPFGLIKAAPNGH